MPDSKPDTANIKQIIEIYDNGHENVFYPDTHTLVRKEYLKKLFKYTEPIKGHEEWYMGIKEKYLSEEEHDEE